MSDSEETDDTRDMLTRIRDDLKNLAFTAVISEAMVAQERYGDFASMHEAYGVLAEEVAELFDGVRMQQDQSHAAPPWSARALRIRSEAIQVAAVAMRIAEQAGRVVR